MNEERFSSYGESGDRYKERAVIKTWRGRSAWSHYRESCKYRGQEKCGA